MQVQASSHWDILRTVIKGPVTLHPSFSPFILLRSLREVCHLLTFKHTQEPHIRFALGAVPIAKMRFLYTAITSLLASVAFSQSISSEVSQLPSCSLSCLTSAITGAGCGLTDYACQCGSAKAAITTSATPCLLKACSTSDALSK